MANFPQPSTPNFFTGFINGSNVVTCPEACRLVQNTPIYNKGDSTSHNSVYNMEDIGGYYCAINSGPPIPHTQRPEGYTTDYFYLNSTNWSSGFSVEHATEDEVYTSPKTDFLRSVYNASTHCSNELPPGVQDPPSSSPPDVPAPPFDGGNCANPQSSLTWFRLLPSMFFK